MRKKAGLVVAFWIEAEAVQASNGAKDVVWHDNPIDD